MVQYYSHVHTLYATENAAVYDVLDTALRDTNYHATITPFKRRRDGRGAYLALEAQFCGPTLWDNMFRDNVAIIMTHTWNGNSNIDSEKFLAQQRHAWIQFTRYVDHIKCVVPDECSRVGYLLEVSLETFQTLWHTWHPLDYMILLM